MHPRFVSAVVITSLMPVMALFAGCGQQDRPTVKIDGSSTVYPISEAVAEEFLKQNSNVDVTVGQSGTGGGFKKFALNELDICDASRAIKDSEREACKKAGIEFVKFEVAYDGLAVVANSENDWVDCLTVDQLKEIWNPDSEVKKWSDIDPSWPEEEIKLYGPGTDSGTFDYFTKAIVGKEKSSRTDYTASEDDNVLVRGVAADKYALGYFGYAYYAGNKDTLKLMGIDDGNGKCVQPSTETVRDGSYKPLSRPLFIYVKKTALARPEVQKFVTYYLDNAEKLAADVNYVAVSKEQHDTNQQNFKQATAGGKKEKTASKPSSATQES